MQQGLKMLMQRRKRGANAIEFALTLPVFLAVFMGAMDWGWYFFLRSQAMNATMIGCEAAARVHPDAAKSPVSVAEDEMNRRFKQLGWECSSLGSTCDYTIDAGLRMGTAVGAHKTVYCDSVLPYTSLVGRFVFVPKTIDVQAEMRMEFQK
jgi:hypothetical protein